MFHFLIQLKWDIYQTNMKLSLKARIYNYIRANSPKVINGGEIERYALQNGYKASNASRRLRELENEGLIQVQYIKGSANYSYKPQIKTIKEPIFLENGSVRIQDKIIFV